DSWRALSPPVVSFRDSELTFTPRVVKKSKPARSRYQEASWVMHRHSDIVAGVLVGGQSRRMGRPKLLLPHPFASSFVEHIVAEARQVVSEVFLLGSHVSLPASLRGVPQLPDVRENGGPLAGLCSLLEVASNRRVLLLACDLPLLDASVLRRLIARAGPEGGAVAFAHKGSAASAAGVIAKWHTCCALYHPRILPIAQRELLHGRSSLQRVLRSVRVTTLQPDADIERLMNNVNTPNELANLTFAQN
ncbi:MAG: molybdenum cofactor guanylyltransferase, partial [Pirellulaceae bacterium]